MSENKYFDNSEYAMAAYATFSQDDVLSKRELIKADFTDAQAEKFINKTEVVTQHDDEGTGFDATVFERDGKLVLAVRGTVPNDDGDIIPTDTSLALGGAGYDQIIAMYNWWQRVSAKPGTLVSQIKMDTGYVVPDGAAILSQEKTTNSPVNGSLYTYTYLENTAVPAANEAEGNIYSELMAAGGTFDVVGHSLGGHLAMAFNSLFPSATEDVFVYNAPGIKDSSFNESFFDWLGGSVPVNGNSNNVHNIIASEVDLDEESNNLTAGLHSRPGNKVDVRIEPEGGTDNHSQKFLVDSLAVYNLLSQMQSDLSLNQYGAIFNAGSQSESASLEGVVDAVNKLLKVSNEKLPIGDRDAMYKAIHSLQDNSKFQALAGSMFIETSINWQDARSNLGAFLSLTNLTNLVFRTNGSSAENALSSLYTDIVSEWEKDKGRDNSERVYTDSYLADRAVMLTYILQRNLSGKIPGSYDAQEFRDVVSGALVYSSDVSPGSDPAKQYVFGSGSSKNGRPPSFAGEARIV
ncbi:hypothetical protein [Microbulbifer epialgicus]|uniref:Lipase (Class 3) n=1 Tax=Microbulbifer epialgicus TaxID=393907 RepID=A0ABV4NVX3_9GAMM